MLWVVELEVEVEVAPVVLLVAELKTDTLAVGEVAVVLVVEELRAGTVTTVAGEVVVVLVVERPRTGDVASAELELLELLTPSRIQLDAVPQLLPAAHQPA